MRPAFKLFAIAAALAVGGSTDFVPKANAEQQPSLSRSVLTASPTDKFHLVPAEGQHKFRAASPRTKHTTRAMEPILEPEPLYLSEAYVKKEQQTEDRLKRTMKICTGC